MYDDYWFSEARTTDKLQCMIEAQPKPSASLSAILFTIVFPTVLTLIYFVLLAKNPSSIQQTTYSIGKVIQFGFPIFYVAFILKEKIRPTLPTRNGVVFGIGFGLLILAAMIALYHFGLKPFGFFDGANEAVREKVTGLGLDTIWKFIGFSIFISLCHSMLEEYYWRWFVFRRLRQRMQFSGAMLISSLGFMSHHVIILAVYFGWDNPLTYLFSLAVAVGGAVWAWLYEKTNSLYGPWLSHLLIDAGIFIVGYDMVRDAFNSI